VPVELFASRIHGLGLRAVDALAAGTAVGRYCGPLVDLKALKTMHPRDKRYLWRFDGVGVCFIDGSGGANPLRYVNHRCEGWNCKAEPGKDGFPTFATAEDVAAGEELTIHYGPNYDSFPGGCMCGCSHRRRDESSKGDANGGG
jgi:uncharacterized protein